jgi:hypothetical protein
MSIDIKSVVNRIKNLREFVIEVEIPDGKTLSGIMPYDVKISKNIGRFKIYAVSMEEAKQRIDEYLEKE